ncbi:TonB-dependent siderophore receptor [Azospirillum sp. RWY-5-1]|uniref:TonB-dependent siderophore receptor n=1 Tax=Azospirillum oleiclasticum TaxID=2735135 RepID=A0ABX2T8V3_9PROT|nr:TonB-dependent siderophore receptor [Azospirillum oleiclasticum]NYZ19643.1 TonB-dependent siderophore receptor [Azospirillum oleiclasticum]
MSIAKPIVASARVSRHVLTASTLGLALGAVASSANAQQTGSSSPTQLPAISVEGQTPHQDYKVDQSASPKRTQPIVDTPQTITIIPRQVIEDQKATTLRDVLRNTPGITFGAGEGGGGQGENLRIRGFDGSNDILLDGMRDSAVRNNRDPFNLEQVEVTKGAASTQSGRGSAGGSINQISKTPQLRRFATADVTVGTDDLKRATADVNMPLTEIGITGTALRLNVMAHDSGVAGRDYVENSRWGVAPSIAFGLGTPLRVTLSYLHQSDDNIPDYGIPGLSGVAPPVDLSSWYGVKGFNTEEQTTDIGTALFEYDVNDAVSLRNQFRYGESTRFNIVTIPRFPTGTTTAFPPGTQVNRGQNFRDSLNTLLVNQTDATFRFTTGPVAHTMVAGMEVARETYKNKGISLVGTVPSTSLYNPNPYGVAVGWAYNGSKTETEGDTLAFYLLDTIKLNEQWEITGGLRWDRYAAEATSTAVGGAVTEYTKTSRMLSWNAGIVYKPLPFGSVYAAASTSFNPSGEVPQTAVNATTSLADPQENVTYEVGTKWELLGERLLVSAALFQTTKTNERSTDPTGTTILDGERQVRGFELGAQGKITDAWQVFGGYTYMDSEIVKGGGANQGNELANTPRHSFSLWTSYDLPWDLRVAGGVQYVGERYFNDNNLVKNDSYVVVDAMVSYKVNDTFGLQLNAYNLFDEEYIDKAHGGGGHLIPGLGRTVMLSTSVSF